MNITKMKTNESEFPWVGWGIVIFFFTLFGAGATGHEFQFSVLFVPLAFGGVYVADWLRRITYPHTIIFNGFWEGLWKKFFWAWGPQLITLIVLLFLIAGIFLEQ